MTDATRFQFTNPSVPKAYDEFLVPRLFEPWANLLLDKIGLRPSEHVLDVATGPGTVARLAAQRVGVEGRICAADVAHPMLQIAKSKPHRELRANRISPVTGCPAGSAEWRI